MGPQPLYRQQEDEPSTHKNRNPKAPSTSPDSALSLPEPSDLSRNCAMAAARPRAAFCAQESAMAVDEGFTRLDAQHIRQDQTGLVIHVAKHKIVDPTGGMYKKQFRDLTRALSGNLMIYDAVKSNEVPGNWIRVGENGLSKYVRLQKLVMCGNCKLYCNTDSYNRLFQDHLAHSPMCQKSTKKLIKCTGAVFYGNVKQFAYCIVTEIDRTKCDDDDVEELSRLEAKKQECIYRLQKTLQDETDLNLKSDPPKNSDTFRELRANVEWSVEKGVKESERRSGVSSTMASGPTDDNSTQGTITSIEFFSWGAKPKRKFANPDDSKEPDRKMKKHSLENGKKENPQDIENNEDNENEANEHIKKEVIKDGVEEADGEHELTKNREPQNGHSRQDGNIKGYESEVIISDVLKDLDEFASGMKNSVTAGFEEQVHIINPKITDLLAEYFEDPFTSTQILPFVLLNCITDDLGNTSPNITENFRFTLRGKNPELFVTCTQNLLPMSLKLSNEDGAWNVCVSLGSVGDLAIIEELSDKLETNGISFIDLCEILVVFRALIYTLISRIGDGKLVPNRADMCSVMEKSFEEHRCGPELSAHIVAESLYRHVSRWKN